MLRSVFAFITWLILLDPAIQAGKVLQSNLYPGPIVKVRFEDGVAIDGKMRYRIDGSEWVVDAAGKERKIDPVKMVVIESILQSESSEPFDITKRWFGVLPLILLTLGFWVSVMPRIKLASAKE